MNFSSVSLYTKNREREREREGEREEEREREGGRERGGEREREGWGERKRERGQTDRQSAHIYSLSNMCMHTDTNYTSTHVLVR